MLYRVKPKPNVDAIQWTGHNLQEVMDLIGGKFIRVAAGDPTTIAVNTTPGPRFVTAGMYLLKHQSGRVSAKEPKAFLQEYELL